MSADVTGSERTGHVFFVELCADLPCVLRNFSYLLTVPLFMLLVCCHLYCQALELISNDVGPDEPAPSQGNKNPAVMKYDPTGLRTTMSTSDKAVEESLKVGVVDAWWGVACGTERHVVGRRF